MKKFKTAKSVSESLLKVYVSPQLRVIKLDSMLAACETSQKTCPDGYCTCKTCACPL